jgi:hypothetical protein
MALISTLSMAPAHAQDPGDMASIKTMNKECLREYRDKIKCYEIVKKQCEERMLKADCVKMIDQMKKEMKRRYKN